MNPPTFISPPEPPEPRSCFTLESGHAFSTAFEAHGGKFGKPRLKPMSTTSCWRRLRVLSGLHGDNGKERWKLLLRVFG